MSFQTAKQSLIRRPTQLVLLRDAPASSTPMVTTLLEPADPGDTTIRVTSATNAALGPIRIGAGELLERAVVTLITDDVLTLARPLRFGAAVGAPVVEQVAYDLGDVDGDVSLSVSQESSDQLSAMRLLPLTILRGNASVGMSFRLLGTTPQNLCVALGMDYEKITGSGTVSAPTCWQSDFADVDSIEHSSLVIVSRKNDARLVLHELWSLATDFTGVSLQLARAQNGAVPVAVQGLSAFLQEDLAAGATPDFAAYVVTTARGTKGNVFRELREVGIFERVGSAVTLNDDGGSGEPGEVSLILSAPIAGLASGDFVVIGSEDTAEIHQVETAAGTIDLRTPLLRRVANGAPVQKVQKVPFFSIAQGGATLAIGGSTSPIISELRDLPIGMQPGSVQATLSFTTMDMLAANIARALGVPASAIVGNRVLLSQLIAQRIVDGVYAEGITQDGRWMRVSAWGTSQEVQNFAIALGSQAPAQLPFVVRPSSGLQLTTWTA